MRLRGLMLMAMAVLSGCAPSFLGGESWGKSMFSPATVTSQAACDAGFDYGQKNKTFNRVGEMRFLTPKGLVAFNTGLGKLYYSCNALGSGGASGKPSSFVYDLYVSDVRFEDASMVGKTAKVAISLEDEQGKEIARIGASQKETEANRQWYSPKSYSAQDIAALNLAKTFTIIVNRGSSDERYKVGSSFTPISPIQEISTNMWEYFSPQVQKQLKEVQ